MTATKIVMLIDDDADDRSLFAEALAEVDGSYKLMTAANGEQALELLQKSETIPPGFVFLDLNMPRMNGWQCLTNVRKMDRLKEVPVIIYTTSQAEEDVEKAKEAGATYFLTKPPKFKDLVHAIFYVLNKKWEKVAELNGAMYKK